MQDSTENLTRIPFGYSGDVFRSPMPFSIYDQYLSIWEGYQKLSISLVVVLVEQQEYLVHARMDLLDFYRSKGLDVIHFPIPDFQTPSNSDEVKTIIQHSEQWVKMGKNMAIHCLAGLGRTGLLIACWSKCILGLTGYDSIDWVRKIIPGSLENQSQENFVLNF